MGYVNIPNELGGGGTGDVVGPSSSTDNAIARFDGTTGKLIQNSTATLSDLGVISASGTNISGLTASLPVATDASKNLISQSYATLAGNLDHNSLTNLATGDVHTQYALLAGRTTGQTLIGGTSASGSLTLESTSDSTKGLIKITDLSMFVTDPDGTWIAAGYPDYEEAGLQITGTEASGQIGTMTIASTGTTPDDLTPSIYFSRGRTADWSTSAFLQQGDVEGRLGFSVPDNTTEDAALGADIIALATENHAAGMFGTRIALRACINGTDTLIDRLSLDGGGSTLITDGSIANNFQVSGNGSTQSKLRYGELNNATEGRYQFVTAHGTSGQNYGINYIESGVEVEYRWQKDGGEPFTLYVYDNNGSTTNLLKLTHATYGTAPQGSVLAKAALGVGNSASATTPGTVTKKMEVFDFSGNSLGFIAIYDAIT